MSTLPGYSQTRLYPTFHDEIVKNIHIIQICGSKGP